MKKLGIPDLNDFVLKVEAPGPTPDDVKSYLESHAYSDELKIPADEGILFFDDILIGSRGNIVAINGRAKSRKSVIASAMMSAIFSDEFLGFTARFTEDPKVLHFDTEQGYGDWLEGCWRVIRDANLQVKPGGFYSHHSRDCMPEMRLELLRYALEMYRPDVLVIDGITDLVYDLNSQDEATKVGAELMAISVKYNCLVVVVIHLTKGNGYMTGALGTYLEKKCQTAIKCELDEDDDNISNISCQYARRKRFQPYGIQYNDQAKQYERTDQTKEITKSMAPGKASPEFKARLLNQVFNLHSVYDKNNDLRRGVLQAAGMLGVSRMTASDISAWVTFWSNEREIGTDPEGRICRVERLQIIEKVMPRIDFNGPEYERDQDLAEPVNPVDDLPF